MDCYNTVEKFLDNKNLSSTHAILFFKLLKFFIRVIQSNSPNRHNVYTHLHTLVLTILMRYVVWIQVATGINILRWIVPPVCYSMVLLNFNSIRWPYYHILMWSLLRDKDTSFIRKWFQQLSCILIWSPFYDYLGEKSTVQILFSVHSSQ